jgi:hypothetical protein
MAAFRRCPKSYQLSYEWGGAGLSKVSLPSYVVNGSSFHAYAAERAREVRGDSFEYSPMENPEMWGVHCAWKDIRGDAEFAAMHKILHIEEPVYTELCGGSNGILERVWLRTTFDLVYENATGWIVCRDYKTFSKMPSNLDKRLNFQMRAYIAALMKKYKTRKVMGEHVYVRQVPPGTPNSKGTWTIPECYIYEPIVLAPHEIEVLWSEAKATARAIVRARKSNEDWWRTDLDGTSPHACGNDTSKGGCFMRAACVAEIEQEALDDNLISILGYVRREPIELPKELQTT